MKQLCWFGSVLIGGLALSPAVGSADTEGRFPFQAGALLGQQDLAAVRPWLPAPVWDRRAAVFGDSLLIGEMPRATPSSDCAGDPDAAARIVWSLVAAGEGPARAVWSFSAWQREASGHDVPGDNRGVVILGHHDAASLERGDAEAEPDFWIYLPERSEPASGRASPDYAWSCLGSADVLAPSGSLAAPEQSPAWTLHEAWLIRFDVEQQGDGSQGHTLYWVDRASCAPLYAVTYEAGGRVERIVLADGRVIAGPAEAPNEGEVSPP